MFPEYSLVVVSSLSDEEVSAIEGEDVEYIIENSDSHNYKLFTFEEYQAQPGLLPYMKPIELFLNGKLTKYHIVQLELVKTFGHWPYHPLNEAKPGYTYNEFDYQALADLYEADAYAENNGIEDYGVRIYTYTPEHVVLPSYSLLLVRALTKEELIDIEGTDLSCVKNNFQNTKYKVFNEFEMQVHKELSKYVRPVKLFSNGKLKKYWVVYTEPLKSYEYGKAYEIADDDDDYQDYLLNESHRIKRGYFCLDNIFCRTIHRDVDEVMYAYGNPGFDHSIFFFTTEI